MSTAVKILARRTWTNCLRLAVLSMTVGLIWQPALAADPLVSSEELPPERRPYNMRLLVAFDPEIFTPSAARSILTEIEQTATNCAGDLWSARANMIDWLNPVNQRGLERLDQSFLAHRYPGETADIWFVATMEALPVGTRVSVRSWQPEVRISTVPVSIDVFDQRELPVSALRLCRDLFRPMGIVEQSTDRSVRVRLRAGELIAPDPTFAQLEQGDLLLPMLAYRDKNKQIERLQSIPWTYISVNDVDGSSVSGTVQSGLKLALGAKKRGRIDTLVVGIRPEFESTRVELLTQSKPVLPLVAHRIEVRSEAIIPRPTEENPDIDPNSTLLSDLITDRRGLATVKVVPDKSLLWLFAFSGQNLLARVPFIPGLAKEAKLEVPDDATRLSAEADLQMLQGEVIDAVALRNTAIATIRAAAKKDDWVTVNQKLALLKRQQDVGSFVDRLIAIRVAGTNAAKARKDKVAEARIIRMCDEATNLINTHLGQEKVRLLGEEMQALQEAEKTAEQEPK